MFIKKDGIRTKAVISDIQEEPDHLFFRYGGHYAQKYHATINFVTKEGTMIESSYSSTGDYLGNLKHHFVHDVEVEYSERNPLKFRLPGDKRRMIML